MRRRDFIAAGAAIAPVAYLASKSRLFGSADQSTAGIVSIGVRANGALPVRVNASLNSYLSHLDLKSGIVKEKLLAIHEAHSLIKFPMAMP